MKTGAIQNDEGNRNYQALHRSDNRTTGTEKGADKGHRYFIVIGGDIWYNQTAENSEKRSASNG